MDVKDSPERRRVTLDACFGQQQQMCPNDGNVDIQKINAYNKLLMIVLQLQKLEPCLTKTSLIP